MRKEPTLEETVGLLRQIENDIRRLDQQIREILYNYDNPTLIEQILIKARKSKPKNFSVSWIQRTLKCGYSKAARLMDDMEDMGLVESTSTSQGTVYRILK